MDTDRHYLHAAQRNLTTDKLSRADAQPAFPGAKPEAGSREVEAASRG